MLMRYFEIDDALGIWWQAEHCPAVHQPIRSRPRPATWPRPGPLAPSPSASPPPRGVRPSPRLPAPRAPRPGRVPQPLGVLCTHRLRSRLRRARLETESRRGELSGWGWEPAAAAGKSRGFKYQSGSAPGEQAGAHTRCPGARASWSSATLPAGPRDSPEGCGGLASLVSKLSLRKAVKELAQVTQGTQAEIEEEMKQRGQEGQKEGPTQTCRNRVTQGMGRAWILQSSAYVGFSVHHFQLCDLGQMP
ncbi:protein transport protein Sec24A-like [Manis pentadactyla]|uniref:protein transport protein Sec24A-like n=1 Tax=Manis pentadactyla TaxID=143292 RepID=UPI00255C99D9|nr:protein transport protein Sec24A-like [Manis pentadactyla]